MYLMNLSIPKLYDDKVSALEYKNYKCMRFLLRFWVRIWECAYASRTTTVWAALNPAGKLQAGHAPDTIAGNRKRKLPHTSTNIQTHTHKQSPLQTPTHIQRTQHSQTKLRNGREV